MKKAYAQLSLKEKMSLLGLTALLVPCMTYITYGIMQLEHQSIGQLMPVVPCAIIAGMIIKTIFQIGDDQSDSK